MDRAVTRLVLESLISDGTLREMVAMARDTPVGTFVEVGVYRGGSAAWLDELAHEQGRELYLFDTFHGIPYRTHPDDGHNVGDFADGATREQIALAFPDAITYLAPRMVVGGVMWFDDYECLKSARAAIDYCLGVPRIAACGKRYWRF